MNKKGFTLLELLAVIVVLAIIALVITPFVSKAIKEAEKKALKNSALGLVESANLYYGINIGKRDFPVEFEINNGVQVDGNPKLNYKGKVKMGYLMLFDEDDMALCVDNGTYAATRNIETKKIELEEGICTGEWDEDTRRYLVSNTSSGFMAISIKSYENEYDLPATGRTNDLAVITTTNITGYYISAVAPIEPQEGMVWVVQSNDSPYYLESDNIRIGIAYVLQYESGIWNLKKAYVYNEDAWKLLYYMVLADSQIDLENSNLNGITTVEDFSFTGEYQKFTAPISGYYEIELWGAQGGTNYSAGGKGAYTKGKIFLDINEDIYIYVGGTTSTTAGGWNGGGNGYTRGGGGATDVRLEKTTQKTIWNEFDSLKSRIMVAAGGSGSTWYTDAPSTVGYRIVGTPGGALNGIDGTTTIGLNTTYSGLGASQTASTAARQGTVGSIGGFGYGGNASSVDYGSASGGGSGYYGGSGGIGIATGGSGSSYISGHEGCSSVTEDSISTEIMHTGDKYHYSGKYFEETIMNVNENTGNGRAKVSLVAITYFSEEDLESKALRNNDSWYFYSGDKNTTQYQTLTIPTSGYYMIEAWGAQGGSFYSAGGLGSYTKGKIYLNRGEVLYIYPGSTASLTTGGWNGGGNGYTTGGGGATDIRLVNTSQKRYWNEFDSLKSRIMVAAGGSGSTWYTDAPSTVGYRIVGTPGGALNGIDGTTTIGLNTTYSGLGASQTASTAARQGTVGSIGGFGYGGNAASVDYASASGGGSGYYGGSGGIGIATGGSGSSYISGHEGCSSVTEDSISTEIMHTGDKYHYSGKYFEETDMQPNINSGNGKAVITLLEETSVSRSELANIQANNNDSWYFYSGDKNTTRYQTLTIPTSGYYTIEAWGAQGGSFYSAGGLGSYTKGKIYLNRGEVLYVYPGSTASLTTGGWNGGGNGYTTGGGGATDIRLVSTSTNFVWNEFDSLKSRIMVAAGGSGSTWYTDAPSTVGYRIVGTPGGALNGIDGTTTIGLNTTYSGLGASQTASTAARQGTVGSIGGFGYGGNAAPVDYASASGGGSGYYGGSGGIGIATGGSGSSYISGHEGCSSITSTSLANSIIHNGSKYHYSGKYFEDTIMTAGVNEGNGKVIVTLIEKINESPTTINNRRIAGNIVKRYYGGDAKSSRYQEFVADKTGWYSFELWGAQGGTLYSQGGRGSYTYGEIHLTQGTKLYVYPGGSTTNAIGGWNGGGNGYTAGGGGATDVRTTPSTMPTVWNGLDSLKTRIIVAAGGSGSTWYTAGVSSYRVAGSNGGGLSGYDGTSTHSAQNNGRGASQIASNTSFDGALATMGGFGYGGAAAAVNYASGSGGGSGWFGGSGATGISTGGTGSSYISGHPGCIGVNSSGNLKTQVYANLADSQSYTGYMFTNTQILDGSGFTWTTERINPSIGDSTLTWHGKAIITYLGE